MIHNPNRDKYLWFPPEQRPIVCQLGGSDPADLAKAAALVSQYGYDEINLNCGCPRCKPAPRHKREFTSHSNHQGCSGIA